MSTELLNIILAVVSISTGVGSIIAFLFTRAELHGQRKETTALTKLTAELELKVQRLSTNLKLLEEQIRELYAPLFYLVMQSEKLLELNKRFHNAYKVEFIDQKYSNNELTRERVKSWTEATIGLANDYVRLVEGNNEKISRLLDSKFAYIDPDDVELFLLFFEDRVRFITEKNDEGTLKTPDQIYEHIGDISYLRPEFIERVKSKFLTKKKELDNYLRVD
jgi:hypothetical protein